MALGEQELHSGVGEHALLHGEALLVIASRDPHNIALRQSERRGGVRGGEAQAHTTVSFSTGRYLPLVS